ncbi:hypothetical protein [Nocardia sp. NPDC019395]|uniref:hypothetical protein n=1 Tax=Nocardia sp. NPDC019395 TaxID=3154686 RepID=UPI0033DCCF68
MTRTTPRRPADITEAFPQLAALARTATRLHPRPGPVTPADSSIGGPLLWPADEPWPRCDGSHECAFGSSTAPSMADVRLLRDIEADSYGRDRTELEQATIDRILADTLAPDKPLDVFPVALAAERGVPTEPIAMLPVAQLYARDMPSLRPPAGADLLQVLWCPFSHDSELTLRTRLFWRASGEITDVLAEQPEPEAVQSEDFVPNACRVHPEPVIEYPKAFPAEGMDSALAEALREWDEAQYENAEEVFYSSELSVAPGCKVGGWAPWGRTDPVTLSCTTCGAPMDPLLTIASEEWDGTDYSWIPYEDQNAADGYPDPSEPTGLMLGDLGKQQLFICSADPAHGHIDLFL